MVNIWIWHKSDTLVVQDKIPLKNFLKRACWGRKKTQTQNHIYRLSVWYLDYILTYRDNLHILFFEELSFIQCRPVICLFWTERNRLLLMELYDAWLKESGNAQFHLGSPCIDGQSSGAYFCQSVEPYLYSTPSNHNSHERQRKSTV